MTVKIALALLGLALFVLSMRKPKRELDAPAAPEESKKE